MELVQPIRDKTKIEAMKKVLRGQSLRDYVLFILGINSGLRISDLLALDVQDVADEKGKPRDRLVVTEQKTGKRKEFPLSAAVQKAIREYLMSRVSRPQEPLFPSRKAGYRLQRRQAYEILSVAAKSVGIDESIGTHTLRKTFGYHAYHAGYDVTRIQNALNHTSPGVTLRYIGITQDDMDEMYMALDL